MINELSSRHPEMSSTEVFENLKGQFPDEVLDIVKGFTLMDDTFMTACYKNNIPAAEETIAAILEMESYAKTSNLYRQKGSPSSAAQRRRAIGEV